MDTSLQGEGRTYSATLIQGPPARTIRGREIWSFMAGLCWHALHFIITVIAFIAIIINKLGHHLFAKGSLKKYRASQGKKPQTVGVVVESQEAEAHISKICDLLVWLADIGVQHVSLYDMEGMFKQSKRSLEKNLRNLNSRIRFISTWEEGKKQDFNSPMAEDNTMTVELLSFFDGKEGIAKAARFICSNTLQQISSDGQRVDLKLTEADIDRGLRATGCAGPEPEILFVFGFARCLLGFPAWRIPLTEIIYMGMLKSLTLNSLVNALDEFSRKNQRYGK
eukprot:Gb_23228 [translate_table: standard]